MGRCICKDTKQFGNKKEISEIFLEHEGTVLYAINVISLKKVYAKISLLPYLLECNYLVFSVK